MSVSLLTVWRAARARAVPFTGESAGYLVFLACEELVLAPRDVSLASIGLEEDGAVRLRGREASDDARAERELRALLAELLEVASSPGLALSRAATRPPSGSLTAFSSELSKALIPFNRAAARRALGRLHRETQRALEAGALADAAAPREPVSAPLPTPVLPTSSLASASPVLLAMTPTPAAVSVAVAPEPLPPRPVSESVATPPVLARDLSPVPPPVYEANTPLNEVMPLVPTEAFVLPPVRVHATPRAPLAGAPVVIADSSARWEPEPAHSADSLTRPETIVARRQRERTPIPEWTEPLPTPLRRVAPVAPLASAESETPAAPTPRLGLEATVRETPFLGSLAAEVFDVVPSREPLAFEIAWDDATDRVPAVFEPEPAPRTLGDDVEWPVELADRSAAIPLEPERDALPAAPEPEPYLGMVAEKSDVRKLLSGFQVAQSLPENDLRSELKRLAGIDETPNPTRFGER